MFSWILLAFTTVSVLAASITWDGGGADNLWSTDNNWDPNGDPAINSDLVLTGGTQLTNNMVSTSSGLVAQFNSIEFASGTSGNFLIGGANLTNGAGGITINSSFAVQMTNSLTALNANQTWNMASNNLTMASLIRLQTSALTIDGNSNITFLAGIAGTGGTAFIKNGTGTLTFSNTVNNTFTGDLIINTGKVNFDSNSQGVDSTAGNVTIGDGIGGVGADQLVYSANGNHILNTKSVTINSSGLWDLTSKDETISNLTLSAGSITNKLFSNLTINFSINANASASSALIAGAGQLILGSGCQINVDDGAAAEDLIISMTLSNLSSTALVKTGAGTLTLSGNNSAFNGPVTNSAGTIEILNANALGTTSSIFNNGGTLLFNVGYTNTGAAVTLASGEIKEIDQNVSLGALTLSSDSTLTLNSGGSSGSMRFASGTNTSGGMLTIYGWNYNSATDSGSDDLIFFTSTSIETSSFLNNITFYGLGAGARLLSTGELVPITPEPNTFILGGMVLVLLAVQFTRKNRRLHTLFPFPLFGGDRQQD
jgi:fibronectin-binding autotransporter adhesin